jgi:hypothetical protein
MPGMEKKTGMPANNPHHHRFWPIPPLILFLIPVFVSALLHVEKASRQKSVLLAREQFATLVRAEPVEEVKAQRSRFYEIRYYLGYPSATSYAVADFVRRLSATIPPRQARELQIDPGVQDFSFRLTVGIEAGGPENAHLAADGYLEEMRKFPEIIWISLAKIDPVPRTGDGDRMRFFSITGQAEMR